MTTRDILDATVRSINSLDTSAIDEMAATLERIRQTGTLYILGNGGGAAHASHACCDFKKLCGITAYCPSDNAAELTARINDEGFDTAYSEWLRASKLDTWDAVLVISVGGGSTDPPVSTNIVNAVLYAKEQHSTVLAIVGRDGGYAGRIADCKVLIPCDTPELVTPVTESVQALVLHALAVHPKLAICKAKWEGLTP